MMMRVGTAGRRGSHGSRHRRRRQVLAVGKTSGSLDDRVHVPALRGRRAPSVSRGQDALSLDGFHSGGIWKRKSFVLKKRQISDGSKRFIEIL